MENKSIITLKVKPIYSLYEQRYFLLIFIFLGGLAKYDLFNFPYKNELLPLLALPLIIRVIWGVFYYHFLRYEIEMDRINIIKGVFSRSVNYIELYRIKDYNLYQSFFMRIFQLMAVTVISSDKSLPVLNIKGISKSNVLNILRNRVEYQRKIKGVREFD